MKVACLRLLAPLAVAGVASTSLLAAAAVGPTVVSDDERAQQSAAWLIGQLDPDATMPGPGTPQDWGLTLDVLFALHSAGSGQQSADRIMQVVEANVAAYTGPAWWPDPDTRLAGPTAKVLLATAVTGHDHTDFGGRDLRQETLALIHHEPGGPEHGRVKDHIVGYPLTDDSNTFTQSLAVIGLARTGDLPPETVDFLLGQQCSEGYFRMFANDRSSNPSLTCDGGKATGMSGADNDGTAMALQALMSARDHGIPGLDEEITSGLVYLVGAQRPDGSFGGGVSTEGSNANSTALAAVTLHAGGRGAQAASAQGYIRGLHLDPATAAGTAMFGEVGAIAYNEDVLEAGLTQGIGVSGDQWRRTTAQAALAFNPVPLGDLGRSDLAPDPAPVPGPPPTSPPTSPPPELSPTTPPSAPGPTPAPQPPVPTTAPGTGPTPTGSSRPPLPSRDTPTGSAPGGATVTPSPSVPGASQTEDDHGPGQSTITAVPDDAATAAIDYLLEQFVDGTHLRTELDGTAYVDHAETARAALALLAADAPEGQVRPVVEHLLTSRAVAEHAHGEPYDAAGAVYVEPLANLVLIATATGADPRDIDGRDLVIELLGTQGPDGWFHDSSDQGDATDTESQARAVLAMTAAGEQEAAREGLRRLVTTQCDDGLFPPADPGATGCVHGQAGATGITLQALNARPAAQATTSVEPTGAPQATERAVAGLIATWEGEGWDGDGAVPVPAIGEVSSGLFAAGAPSESSVTWLIRQAGDDGGLPVSPGGASDRSATISTLPALARSSYLTIPDGPLLSAGYALQTTPRTSGAGGDRTETTAGPAVAAPAGSEPASTQPAWPWLLIVLGAGATGLLWRSRHADRKAASPPSPNTTATAAAAPTSTGDRR